MIKRPRRLRVNESIRSMVREHSLSVKDLIAPLFVIEGENKREPIESMPGQARLSIDLLVKEAKELEELGVPCLCLFPAIEDSKKDKKGSESTNIDGLYPRAIRAVKEACPTLQVMTDVALDPYSSDGHDGLVSDSGEILNDETITILKKMAVAQAKAGADIIGPSDMMDGRVGAIREALDDAGFKHVLIMSYTAKYASSFYGPFRDALDSAPKGGDKKSYQMDPANSKEALIEASLDEAEGADFLMVKPGLPYLDVIKSLSEHSNLPITAYNVSGEYAMIKAASEKGWLDEDGAILESLLSFKRAGASGILTYFAKDAAKLLQ